MVSLVYALSLGAPIAEPWTLRAEPPNRRRTTIILSKSSKGLASSASRENSMISEAFVSAAASPASTPFANRPMSFS